MNVWSKVSGTKLVDWEKQAELITEHMGGSVPRLFSKRKRISEDV